MSRYQDIEYSLRRSRRKTASIFIERDGSVALIVPRELPDKEVEALLERKLAWIYKSLAEWRSLNAAKVQREFVNGEGFLYLGRTYRLKLVQHQEVPLLLKDGYFLLNTSAQSQLAAEPQEIFRDFYRTKGFKRIPERVAFYQPRIGVQHKGLRIMELGHRWASCSVNGVLNFHWKCMMAPMTVLDYIVVHELSHILHPRHTNEFWEQVDKVLPDWRERLRWLERFGASLDL